jgi:hypothetical protein
MAGPSSRLDDSEMLEYLDTSDSDSDFILESVTDDTSEEDDAPHATPLAAHPMSNSEEDDMGDEDYREILLPEQPLPLPFQVRLDLSMCVFLVLLLLLLTFISSSQT